MAQAAAQAVDPAGHSSGEEEAGDGYDQSSWPGPHCGPLHKKHADYVKLQVLQPKYRKVCNQITYRNGRGADVTDFENRKKEILQEAWALFDGIDKAISAANVEERMGAATTENVSAMQAQMPIQKGLGALAPPRGDSAEWPNLLNGRF